MLLVQPKRKPFIKMTGMQTLFHRSGFLAFGGGGGTLARLSGAFVSRTKANTAGGPPKSSPFIPFKTKLSKRTKSPLYSHFGLPVVAPVPLVALLILIHVCTQ